MTSAIVTDMDVEEGIAVERRRIRDDEDFTARRRRQRRHETSPHDGRRECSVADSVVTRKNDGSSSSSPSESTAMCCLKLALWVVLLASSVSCALLVHRYASDAERRQFQDRFQDESTTVMESLLSSLFLSLGALDSFVLSSVSAAAAVHHHHHDHHHNDTTTTTWPFVVIPDFAVRAAKVRGLSKAFCVYEFVVVSRSQRAAWRDFAARHNAWVREGMEVQRRDENYHGIRFPDYVPYGLIPDYDDDDDDTVPFLPQWQTYPVVHGYPPHRFVRRAFARLRQNKVVMRVANLPAQHDDDAEGDDDAAEVLQRVRYANEWAVNYIRHDDDPAEPMVELYYPMSDTAHHVVNQAAHDENDDGSIVGVFTASMYWKELLQGILPPGTGGVLVTFEFGNATTFTYAIDGPEAVYLGRDAQPPQQQQHQQHSYGMERSFTLGDAVDNQASYAYTGLPLSEETARFRVRICPSAKMEELFITNDPVIYTVVAVLAFAFTSALFVVYDRCSERRQQKAMNTVVRSEANVALLEDMVRERTRELEASKDTIEAASAAQLQHFAAMSHEIRTPMNGIIGLSSLLQQTELTPLQSETMKMIVASGELLVAVVNDVLDYSRLESGFVDVNLQTSNLQDTLSNTVQCVQLRRSDGDVSVQTFYDDQVPEFVTTDARRLQQILFNLLGNAVKFSHEGGTVEFHASICESCAGTLYPGSSSSRTLQFVVKDYGRGIKAEDLDLIFEPFSQAGRDTATQYGGTGLGLAITRRLVDGLGGAISVKSEFGKWSEFKVDLPLREDTANIDDIAARLRQTGQIVVVGDPSDYEIDRVTRLFDKFGVNAIQYNTLDDIKLADEGPTTLYIVQEQSCSDAAFCRLKASDGAARLVTFGSNFSANESWAHYRSLTGVLPCVLFRQLVEIFDATPSTREHSPRNAQRRESKQSNTTALEVRKDLRFLIAEDNLVNRKVLKRILVQLGFEHIDVVVDGQAAIDAEGRNPYDLIWMDMDMPIVDGVEACRVITSRSAGGHPIPKVVFCTAHVQQSYEQECLDSGAVGFLPKPCNIQTVRACLEKIAHLLDP